MFEFIGKKMWWYFKFIILLNKVFFTVMDRVKEMLDANIPLRSGTWNLEEISKINELIPQVN